MLAEMLAAYAVSQDPTKLVYPVCSRPRRPRHLVLLRPLAVLGTLGWPEKTPMSSNKYYQT